MEPELDGDRRAQCNSQRRPGAGFHNSTEPDAHDDPDTAALHGLVGLLNVSFLANFAEMPVQQSGTRVSGSLAFGPHDNTFTGTTSQDGRVLTGR